VVVSTDDEEIAAISLQEGAEVPFLRPAHLAGDNSPKWGVFQHLVQMLEARDNLRVDAIADLDAGCPLRLPDDVSACVDRLLATDAEVVITASEPERNPYFNMVEVDNDGLAHVVKPLPRPITDRQSAPCVYSLSPSVFAIRRDALTAYSHWSEAKVRLHLIPRERAVDIDSETDFRYAEMLLTSQAKAGA
jgi:N-acylneuraminate cytidylyltransferase/CMP-N,N'-diacetyllegionaminic acid synthase